MSALPPLTDLQPTQAQPTPPRWPLAVARCMQWLVLGGLWLGWPLSPVAIALIQGSMYPLRRYAGSLVQCGRMLKAMARKDVIYRNALRKLQPAVARKQQIEGQCTHCGRCCVDHQCVFLVMHDAGDGLAPRSSCSIYGSPFFRLTSCGEYPMTGADIAAYDCPSFEAKPVGSFRHTIPIRPANEASKQRAA